MNPGRYLTPEFAAMPAQLRALQRWVVWKPDKKPFCAGAVNSIASVTSPGDWASFEQAQTAFEEGGYSGVGFVLAGDGIVGIDLDKCVDAGKPATAALSLLDRIGCQYIELSPSATGLRGFGFGESIIGTRGQQDGVNVELYSSKRYLTVTGHSIREGLLVPLPGFAEVARALHRTDLQRRAEEEQKKTDSILCLPLLSSVGELPARTIPTQVGQRHRCVFELARYLKSMSPGASRQELRDIVASWHARHLAVIGTKEFAVTWTDFLNGWEKVRQPYGVTMKSIVAGIDLEAALPDRLLALGYGTAVNRLIKICAALQAHHGREPMFLAARQAGELLGVHYTDASKMLAALVNDGVLQLVSKGAGRVASRYRFVEAAWHA